MLEYFIVVVLFLLFCFVKQFEIHLVCETCCMNELSFFLLGLLSCGVITHGHGDVCSPPLRQLCLPIDVNGHHWFQHYLLDWLIIKETGDLAWSDQEFELVPLSIVQSLRGSTSNNFINTKRLYQYKETFRECPNLWERSAFESWTKLDVKSIVNVSNH